MGQKVHPYGFRLGVTKTWRSRWFAKQDYAKLLREDLELKDSLRERLKAAGVSSIEVDRPGNKLRITIHTSRPGIIIGRKGAEIEKLEAAISPKKPSAKSSSIFRKFTSPSWTPSWLRNPSRCSSKNAWLFAEPCEKRSIRRCASAARESKFAFRDG